MPRLGASPVVGLVAAALLAAPTSAVAWNSINSTGGNPLSWPSGNPETTWSLSSNYTSNELSGGTLDSALNAAMNEWGVPGCTSFNATQGSDRSGDPTNGSQNADLIGWMESGWPAAWGDTTLAVTTPASYPDGEIAVAAMAFNGVNHLWTWGNPSSWQYADVQAVAAHEFGHWIGFDHNSYSGSTLQAFYSGGTGERTLTCDDTEGVCTMYPSSGNSCTADRYCECSVGCDDGLCDGVPGDDDDATPGDDDDDIGGECSGPDQGMNESEPNDWVGEDEVDYEPDPGGGDFTFSGSISCGNDPETETYSADRDWVVIDFPCSGSAQFVLDWNGSNSDLDFYVYGSTGDFLAANNEAETEGPITATATAGGRLFILVMCWEGSTTNYDLTVDWAPFDDVGDDDDATQPPDDDDATEPPDDDDATIDPDDDDDDNGDDDDDGDDDDSRPIRRGCACQASATPASGLLALGLGLGVLGLGRRRQ